MKIKIIVGLLALCCSCTVFIPKKHYVSNCINRQDEYCYTDTSKDLRYSVIPESAVKKGDSLFFEVMVTSSPLLFIDGFKISCLYDNVILKGNLVSKDTNSFLTNSNWKFAWKEYTRKNFWKSHILIIEPAVIRNDKLEQLPPNEFRWQKKHK